MADSLGIFLTKPVKKNERKKYKIWEDAQKKLEKFPKNNCCWHVFLFFEKKKKKIDKAGNHYKFLLKTLLIQNSINEKRTTKKQNASSELFLHKKRARFCAFLPQKRSCD